jgi:hypothetical protein
MLALPWNGDLREHFTTPRRRPLGQYRLQPLGTRRRRRGAPAPRPRGSRPSAPQPRHTGAVGAEGARGADA